MWVWNSVGDGMVELWDSGVGDALVGIYRTGVVWEIVRQLVR